ncbi:hypothetical protein D6777_00475 [Candidatus Woesearchaeota archaeon]|nr:MAG: hypothetical protein D6777_00475 [Candidatus Woesearchaeota archaeon]
MDLEKLLSIYRLESQEFKELDVGTTALDLIYSHFNEHPNSYILALYQIKPNKLSFFQRLLKKDPLFEDKIFFKNGNLIISQNIKRKSKVYLQDSRYVLLNMNYAFEKYFIDSFNNQTRVSKLKIQD